MRFLKSALVAATAMTLLGSVLGESPALAEYSQTPSFSWVPSSTVYSLAQSGNTIYIGGTFTSVRNPKTGEVVARDRLAALDATTGELLSWNPGADATVRSLATAADGTVYVGGDFTTLAGVPATRLGAVTSLGSTAPGFVASASSTVKQIRVDGADVYVAGEFTQVDAVSRLGVAKINANTGALDTTWNARIGGGRVRALALDAQGDVVIGGSFTKIKTRAQSFLGRVSKATGADSGWAPTPACSDCQVLDLDTQSGYAYAAIGGSGGGRVGAYALSGTTPTWLRSGDGDVQAVDVAGDTVYLGGHFGPKFSGDRNQLAAVSTSNGALLPFSPSLATNYHPGTWDLLATDSHLYVGGGFRMAKGPYARYGSFPLAP